MNATVIEVPAGEALRAFEDYQEAVRTGRGARTDKVLMRAYRAVKDGKRLLDLHETMKQAGTHEDTGLPKLAIARANAEKCYFRWTPDGGLFASSEDGLRYPHHRHYRVELPRTVLAAPAGARTWTTWSDVAPLIPPRFRPAFALSNYHLLWEAAWTEEITVDPILLRHLEGALYVVLAEWDLSPLERAVLAGKL